MQPRITAAQYRKSASMSGGIGKISKKNRERLESGLPPENSEDDEQIRVVNYLEGLKLSGHIECFTSIPNSTRTPYMGVLKKQNDIGLRKGLCDLFIIYYPTGERDPRHLFLEMKIESGGSVSPEQKQWIRSLRKVPGNIAEVARGYDEAKRIIDALVFPGIPYPTNLWKPL